MEQRAEEKDGTSKKRKLSGLPTALTAEVYTSAFTTAHIKAILQKEKDIGILLKPAIDLVGACSAVFLRDLLVHAERAAQLRNGTSGSPTCLQLEDLKKAIEKNSQFQILEGILDNLDEIEHSTTTTRRGNSLLPMRRKQPTTIKPRRKPKANMSSSKPKSTSKDARSSTTSTIIEDLRLGNEFAAPAKTDSVVPDEEDYD